MYYVVIEVCVYDVVIEVCVYYVVIERSMSVRCCDREKYECTML